jgi:orotidine-5'-phosphate decarboxylase
LVAGFPSGVVTGAKFTESHLPPEPRDRLIVALDLPGVREAGMMVETLGDAVTFYKVGYQLAFAGGLAFVERLIGAGKRVFLDMKLHDIENTVSKGVESAARLGVTFLTIHAYPQTMNAAVAARKGSGLKVLAVTVLTSYDDIDLAEAGYSTSVEALVALRAQQAHDLGVDGLVCSPEEASPLRLAVGPDMLFVTPGVRPVGAAQGDQKRVATPTQAIVAGADYLVVGRPITEAADPKAAAEAIVAEIAAAARA